MPSFSQNEIILRPRTFHTISNALEKAGMGINEANALVNETHGLYIPMKKKIFNGQYIKRPKLLDALPSNIKKAALLVGQWTDSDGDKEIVSLLSGMKYDDFVDSLIPFSKDEDPFVHIVESNGNRTFYLASVENSWEYLDIPCEDIIWDQFKNLFVEVLNESEQLFIYSPQERMIAQFKGERLFWSSVLRNGMIRSLIMKAYYKNDMKFQTSLDDLISNILQYVQTEEQWKYISNFFIDLCEVAPSAIIDRLFMELEKSTGLIKLFDTQTSDFILGNNCYIDILFGVDEFLVQDEYAARGYEWLLKLDDRSFEYKSNSPKDTIEKVLCSWCNFSVYKSVDDKVFAARKALELDRNAWNYVFDALPTNSRSILGEIHKPKYRAHVETSPTTIQEMQQTAEQYVLLLIERADYSPERWGKLIGIADELSEEMAEKIFSSMLFQASQMSEFEQVNLKKQIRQLIYKHRYFASASWAMGEEKVERLEQLLKEIVIPIPEYEYAYLFSSDRNTVLLNPVPYDEDGKRDVNEEKTAETIRNKIIEFNNNELDFYTLAKICSFEDNSYLGRYWALYGTEEEINLGTFEILYKVKEQKGMALDYCQGMYLQDKNVFTKVFALKDVLEFNDDFIVGLYRIQALNTEEIPLIDLAEDHIKSLFWNNDRVYISANFEWALKECKQHGSVAPYIELLYQINRICKFDNEILFNYLTDIHKMPFDNRMANVEYYLAELLKPLQDEYADDPQKASKLVEIEVNFFGVLDWNQMRCFHNEIKRTPDIFAEMVSIVFKKDNTEKIKERTEEQTRYVNAIYRLYDMAHFCPAESNGIVIYDELDKWIKGFRNLLTKNNQQSLFGFLLGRLWSFSPVGEDNYYPCEAVRTAIENYSDDSMISEYKVALFNQRGVFSPSAGREEKAIAERYKTAADFFKLRYPKTAEVFYGMYRRYMAEAEEERSRAENGHF